MKKFSNLHCVQFALVLILALGSEPSAWGGVYQHGTVVRMRTVDCLPVHHGFMTAMSGPPAQISPEVCPEYTLVSDKVVFIIVGRSSDQVVPLADIVDFRFYKNELAMRIDDARHESKFIVKEMILRSEWDLIQRHISDQMANSPHPSESNLALRTREQEN